MSPIRFALFLCALWACPITPHAAQARNIGTDHRILVNANTIDIISPISVQIFRNRLADFLERVFWEKGEALSPADRLKIVNLAIQDCTWLEVCRENDVVSMAVLRLVAPDLVDDPAYRDAVIEQVPNPVHRTGSYLGETAYHMTQSDKEMFYGKLNFWWEFVKGEI